MATAEAGLGGRPQARSQQERQQLKAALQEVTEALRAAAEKIQKNLKAFKAQPQLCQDAQRTEGALALLADNWDSWLHSL
jgi:hypothetical protein